MTGAEGKNIDFNIMLDLSIIIVNFNGLGIINNCIESIDKYLKKDGNQDGISYEIIVADNASKDGSAEMLEEMSARESMKHLKVMPLNDNNGFGQASNIAAGKSAGRYILFLNPDTEFMEYGLERLLDFYEKKSAAGKTGVMGAKLLNDDMSLQYSCRSFLTLARQFYESFFLSRLFKKSRIFGSYFMTFAGHYDVMETDWISGAFMFVNRDIFFNTGGFDRDYFMYSEDSDICLKLKRAGYKNYYYPFFRVKHKDAAIASSNQAARDLQIWKSRRLYFKKNYSQAHGLAFSAIYTLHIILRIFLYYFISLLKGKNAGGMPLKRAVDYRKTLKMYFSR